MVELYQVVISDLIHGPVDPILITLYEELLAKPQMFSKIPKTLDELKVGAEWLMTADSVSFDEMTIFYGLFSPSSTDRWTRIIAIKH